MEKQALAAAGQPVLASHQETLLPSEQQTLQEIARRKVENIPDDLKGKALAELWSRLHHKFRVSKYHQLPRTQFADALVYIQQMTLRCVPQPQQYAVEYITSEQYYKLKHLVWLIGNCFHRKGGGEWAAWRVIRQEQGIEGATKIPADRYDAVHQRLTEIQGMASAFRALVHEFETLFFRKNFGALPDETQLKQLGLN
ncbi:MAG TPA: ORF6C domain-containing protein [Candidatus Competibacteraceae bacterium]|nr:ORF6C domain-containing protein [Candidatus Competibacteraceae bacterium]